MKKLEDKLKMIRFSIAKYIYSNRLFITYFILAIIGTIVFQEVTINKGISKPFFVDFGLILLIGSFGYFIKPKNQFKYLFTWLIIFTLMEVVNSVYNTFYDSFASFAELSTLSQTKTVTDAVTSKLRIIDFIYVLQPIVFYRLHHSLKMSSYYNILGKIEKTKTMFVSTLIASLVFLGYAFSTASGTDYSRLSTQWNKNYIVERFGVIMYQFNDLVQTIIPRINTLFGYEDALAVFNDYFENREAYDGKNKYTGILDGYNVVYVHMESMQNFLMDLSFNGEQVTPNLNKLANEGLFFSNFYPQISSGTSSDAEYIMLSGMLPVSSGTVFVTYAENTFKTVPTYLTEKGYYTFSMHGNYASMWNRSIVHPRLGYQEMYYRDTFEFDPKTETVGLGINDKLFFKQAVQKLETIEQTYENYFGTVITLSNHTPFKKHEDFTLDITDHFINSSGEKVSTCYLCDGNNEVGRYIVSSHYADEALGDFLNYIKESDYFNETVFVFYGDHDARISYDDMNYFYNYDKETGKLKNPGDKGYVEYDTYAHQMNKKTPLIMWTKNKTLQKKLTGEVKTVMGMYDAAPTLYNMLNIDAPYTLGHDIFNIKNDNIVVYPNGNYLTESVYYNNSTGRYKILKEGTILEDNYISKMLGKAEDALKVGNVIVMYDIFNEKKTREYSE